MQRHASPPGATRRVLRSRAGASHSAALLSRALVQVHAALKASGSPAWRADLTVGEVKRACSKAAKRAANSPQPARAQKKETAIPQSEPSAAIPSVASPHAAPTAAGPHCAPEEESTSREASSVAAASGRATEADSRYYRI